MIQTSLNHQLAIAIISVAKAHFSDSEFQQLAIPKLQQVITLISECVVLEHLSDKVFLLHIADSLINQKTVEETVMHAFLLSIYRLVAEGSNHPLEKGIIKQKINGILPIFENACVNGLVNVDFYNKNADALVAIADDATDKSEIIHALAQEYQRLAV